jgi:hypothetical protein
MAIRISTGLRAALLSDFGVTAMMNYGVIDVYTGAQPLAADQAPTGTRVGQITGGGLVFIPGTTQGGLQIVLDDSFNLVNDNVWQFKGVTTGTAGWWRWKWNLEDDDSLSLYYPRIDGLVGDSLTLATNDITPSTDVSIDSFILTVGG